MAKSKTQSISLFEASYRRKIILKKILVYAVCIFFVLLAVVPFLMMFMGATKSKYEINGSFLEWAPDIKNSFVVSLLPSKYIGSNWAKLFSPELQLPILSGFFNSFIISVCSTVLSVYFSALTAYGFTVYRFRANKPLYGFIMLILMVPSQVGVIGFIEFIAKLGLRDTFIPLIIPAIAAPSTVFFLRQYMMSALSIEMVEAGRIDGCSEFGIFNRLVFPILKPGIATMAIFGMVSSWNNFFLPLIVLSSKDKLTIPIVVSLLLGNKYQTEFGSIYLGLSLTALPLIVFYLILSKYIIAGTALGGVKE